MAPQGQMVIYPRGRSAIRSIPCSPARRGERGTRQMMDSKGCGRTVVARAGP